MEKKQIAVLGSTGSIGTQTLDVAEKLGFSVTALTAGKNAALLEKQVRRFRPSIAAMADEAAARDLRARVADLPVRVLAGPEGVCEAAAERADAVLNAVVGLAGLAPTMAALRAGNTLALANKESLVAAGELVLREAEAHGARVLPVDSEHSAIFQCLQGVKDPARELRRIWLTASGGPFFGKTRAQLETVTREQALRHPTWNMGAKITVDSATLLNKGLELIEACRLFSLPPERVTVVVHPQSIVHSAVELADGAVLAQLGVADMRIPIQYALTYPSRVPSPAARLNLFETAKFTFARPDPETFRCLAVCAEAARRGGLYTAAVSGAGEEADRLFLEGTIGFAEIGDLVAEAALAPPPEGGGLQAVYEADRLARARVRELAGPGPV